MTVEFADGVRKGIVLACVWGEVVGLCVMCAKHNIEFAILFSTVTICGMIGVVGEYIVTSLRKE